MTMQRANWKHRFAAWHLPYPLSRGARIELGHSLLITLFAALVIWVTRPFGLGQLPTPMANRLILELSAICFACDGLMRGVLPAWWAARHDDSTWTSGAELVRTLIELSLLATALLAWLSFRTGQPFDPTRWMAGVAITALCALGPIALRVLLTERRLRRSNQSQLEQRVKAEPPSSLNRSGRLRIEAGDGQLELDCADWRYARADQNYVTVVWCQHGERQERLLRLPLNKLEQQISECLALRCHRSYLVSLDAISAASGNAQGYQLRLRDLQETVPVSRSRLAAFDAAWPNNKLQAGQ